MEEYFRIERTRTGLPAMWESGGSLSHTGRSIIITGPNGERLKPVFIKRKGHRACGDHALFVVHPKDHVIIAARQRENFRIAVYQIEEMRIRQFVPPYSSSTESGLTARREHLLTARQNLR
jgi:hypothetical protein